MPLRGAGSILEPAAASRSAAAELAGDRRRATPASASFSSHTPTTGAGALVEAGQCGNAARLATLRWPEVLAAPATGRLGFVAKRAVRLTAGRKSKTSLGMRSSQPSRL